MLLLIDTLSVGSTYTNLSFRGGDPSLGAGLERAAAVAGGGSCCSSERASSGDRSAIVGVGENWKFSARAN